MTVYENGDEFFTESMIELKDKTAAVHQIIY